MKTGVQSLGWYVLRANDPVPLIRFYRDEVGLGELRGREDPPEQASAMLWAGGTTVFEPNRLAPGGNQPVPSGVLEQCAFVPVFQSRDLDATLSRIAGDAERTTDTTFYFLDPLGFYFGVEAAPSDRLETRNDPDTDAPLTLPDIKPLADDLLDLARLEYRVADPERTAVFYQSILGMKRLGSTGSTIRLNMGDGAILDILEGGTPPSAALDDREQASIVPVYRLYGYDAFKTLMNEAGASCLQEVELTGGRLWYGWDQAGHLFGFQERKPPLPDEDKWMTRLPEDLMAKRLWDVSTQ